MTPEEERIKYLEMIQKVIERLAQHSFIIKGWSVTLVSALLAFGGEKGDPRYAWLAVAAAIVFGGLDAYYLQLERRFRLLYTAAVSGSGTPTFSMDISGHCYPYVCALIRPAVLVPHLLVVVLGLVVPVLFVKVR
jgi:hypothetical protein